MLEIRKQGISSTRVTRITYSKKFNIQVVKLCKSGKTTSKINTEHKILSTSIRN